MCVEFVAESTARQFQWAKWAAAGRRKSEPKEEEAWAGEWNRRRSKPAARYC